MLDVWCLMFGVMWLAIVGW